MSGSDVIERIGYEIAAEVGTGGSGWRDRAAKAAARVLLEWMVEQREIAGDRQDVACIRICAQQAGIDLDKTGEGQEAGSDG